MPRKPIPKNLGSVSNTLVTIGYTPASITIIDSIRSKLSELTPDIERIRDKALVVASTYALKVVKSYTPIDTFDLRGYGVDDGMIKTNPIDAFNSSVVVTNDPHTSRLTGETHTAAELFIALLDNDVANIKQKRSRNANKFPGLNISGGDVSKGSLIKGFFSVGAKNYIRSHDSEVQRDLDRSL